MHSATFYFIIFCTSRVVCRALLIPFIHRLDFKIQSSTTFNAYELASAAGHQLVNIDDDKLEEKITLSVFCLVLIPGVQRADSFRSIGKFS